MRVLITGGAGFIGARLSRFLEQQGHSVVVLDNLSEQVHRGSSPPDLGGAKFLRGDVRDRVAVTAALEGVDAVYHLAAETGVGQSQYEIGRYVSVNVHGTAVVLESCVAAGIGRLILSSSRAIYGEGRHRCTHCGRIFQAEPRPINQLEASTWNILCSTCGAPTDPMAMAEECPPNPTSIYGLTKLQQEQLALAVARRNQVNVTVLRLFNVFGPGQTLGNPYTGVIGTFFHRARRGEGIELFEDGEMLRDFIFVDDVVEALESCLTKACSAGRVINVAAGRRITLRAVAEAVCATLGQTPQASCQGRFRLGDVRHAFGDPSTAEALLGFTARTSFEAGLNAYVAWALAQKEDRDEALAEEALLTRGLLRRSLR